ncbi:putative F-box protein At3g16210 [Lycium barbarum]|uniref:putative F-box protein At3g16210 n=1 Tax=Lycium barbarum TaxID=112863 RepID=UPI00293EE743|nr:putative F-box protein At3g16210 [Lycium barbarum]
MEHSMLFIPHDILFFILIRLHVKSLLRFQSVSKAWKAIICDKIFKKTHRDQSKVSSPQKLLLVQLDDGVFEFRDLKNPQIAIRKQKFPLKRFQQVPALCSCDGLVLLKSHTAYKSYVLWNPYTNDYRIFKCEYVKAYSCTTPHACGFCYDSSADDYKVILVYKSFYAVCYVSYENKWMKRTSVHVQELNARSWECSQGISVEGRVFWSIQWKINHLVRQNSKIIYFDVKSDEVKELQKPDFIGENDQLYRLTSLKGCVGLYGGKIHSKTFDVWIMEQDEWKLLMNISCNFVCERFIVNSVLLGCMNHNEILFQTIGIGLKYFVIYDLERHQFVKRILISKDSRHYTVPICSESLYFPKPNIKRKRKQLS